MRRMMVMVSAMAAAGCTPAAAPSFPGSEAAAVSVAPGVMCNANTVQDLIGKRAADVSADAQARSGAHSVRTYKTGDPVTMDYRPDRLDVETDANGVIVKLSCG